MGALIELKHQWETSYNSMHTVREGVQFLETVQFCDLDIFTYAGCNEGREHTEIVQSRPILRFFIVSGRIGVFRTFWAEMVKSRRMLGSALSMVDFVRKRDLRGCGDGHKWKITAIASP